MHLTKTLFSFYLMFSLSLSFFGQEDITHFQPLKSKGELPADFTQRTSRKVEEAIDKQISVNDDIHVRRTKENFLRRSNYMVDNLLMSGNVLFGDPVTQYVNKVADQILKDEPELRDELRFYCIKSNVTNAFATNQGMIFITTGLIAQLENEAQLAFVLGHEINHYKGKHVIHAAIENDKIVSNSKRKKMTQDQTIKALSSYSKALELESDSIGFYYLRNAGYNLEAALNSFNVLQFASLPYDEIEFDYSQVETAEMVLPPRAKLDTLVAINFEVDEDDSKSSHPNLNLRREKIEAILDENENTNKDKNYIVSKDEFTLVRELCRFESIRIDLKNLDYVKAYYHAVFLSKFNPDNIYLQKSKAKALYGISKFLSSHNYFSCAKKYTKYEGAISAFYYFFEKNPKNLIYENAIKTIFEINKKHSDEYLALILQDLVDEFIRSHGEEEFDFEDYFPVEVVSENDSLSTAVDSSTVTLKDIEGESKYDKLKRIRDAQKKKKKTTKKKKTENNYHHFIFTNYEYRDEIKELFVQAIEDINEELAAEKREDQKYDDLDARDKNRAKQRDADNKINEWLHHNEIGAEKVVFVDPFYYTIDERKGIKLENSEDKKYTFYDQINNIGEMTNLDVEILSPKLCSADDANKINDLSICNDWVEELSDLEDVDEDLEFIPSQSEYMKQLTETYQTEYFAFSGVVDYKKKKKFNSLTLVSMIFPYGWPYFVGWVLKPQHEVYYYTYVFDANTGDLKVDQVYTMKRKAMEANINSFMYDNFLTIKTVRK